MTTLYFLRHATAEVVRPGQLDIDRCLIDKGRQQATKVANFMLRHGINPQQVFTSPYPRALQTAAIVCEQALLAPAAEVNWLALETPVEQALQALAQARAHLPEQCLLVGHEPDLSLLISRLLGSEFPVLKVRKASLTCLQLGVDSTLAPCAMQWSIPVKLMT